MTDVAESKPRLSRRAFLGTMLAALAAGGFAGVIAQREAASLQVERRRLRVPGWTADGFRLAIVSDLHLRNEDDVRLALNAYEQSLAANPQAIVIVGDFATAKHDHELEFAEAFLRGIRGHSVPVFGALGNHDYHEHFAGHCPIREIAVRQNFHLLVNEVAATDKVTMVGFDDALRGTPDYRIPERIHGPNVIGLLHEPDFVSSVPAQVHLVLSGHSHGGQICPIPGVPLYTPNGARKFRRGWYPSAPRPLYVSRGLGTVGLPLRLNCPPELTIMDLWGTA